jgi:hypothetical protein
MVRHWRATRSRNSRPELIADDEQGAQFLPSRPLTGARGRPSGGGTRPQVLVVLATLVSRWLEGGALRVSVLIGANQDACHARGMAKVRCERAFWAPRLSGWWIRRRRMPFPFGAGEFPDRPSVQPQAADLPIDFHIDSWARIEAIGGPDNNHDSDVRLAWSLDPLRRH